VVLDKKCLTDYVTFNIMVMNMSGFIVNYDDLKSAASYIIKGMDATRGRVEIDVNTAFNSASVKVTKFNDRIENGEKIQVAETKVIK
jgi:hypothetical protein